MAWPKKTTKTESKEPTNSEEKIHQLQAELVSLKSKLNNLSDSPQKTELENKLNSIESQLDNSPQLPTLKKLEQEIKEIKKELEEKEPDDDPGPTNKNKAKVEFKGKSLKVMGDSDNFDNYKFVEEEGEHIFYISKNHPRIKELLSQDKLQEDKEFTIRYGKVDEKSDGEGLLLTFNENNQELEIIEVKKPSPQPNPDPNQNKLTKYIVTKINDNTFKYRFTVDNDKQNCRGFDDVSYSDFINLLKTSQHPQHKEFFAAFQGALKDANSKFPALFWKCPPVSKKTLDKPFEFVVIKSEALADKTQNYGDFESHLTGAAALNLPCVSFSSPNNNILVIPSVKFNGGSELDYKNISQFTKNASEEQQKDLWREVADRLSKELEESDTPRWLNTEGLGVYYLHVRIDKSSRFYSNYPEYKIFKE